MSNLYKLFSFEETSFLEDHQLSELDVYDARFENKKLAREKAKNSNKQLIYGTPCIKHGHRLRTRAGHCVICDPTKLRFQQNYHGILFDPVENLRGLSNFYVAGSLDKKLIKVGISKNIEYRLKQLNVNQYAESNNWKILFTHWVSDPGETETKIKKSIEKFQIKDHFYFDQDGKYSEAKEVYNIKFSVLYRLFVQEIKEQGYTEIKTNWHYYKKLILKIFG